MRSVSLAWKGSALFVLAIVSSVALHARPAAADRPPKEEDPLISVVTNVVNALLDATKETIPVTASVVQNVEQAFEYAAREAAIAITGTAVPYAYRKVNEAADYYAPDRVVGTAITTLKEAEEIVTVGNAEAAVNGTIAEAREIFVPGNAEAKVFGTIAPTEECAESAADATTPLQGVLGDLQKYLGDAGAAAVAEAQRESEVLQFALMGIIGHLLAAKTPEDALAITPDIQAGLEDATAVQGFPPFPDEGVITGPPEAALATVAAASPDENCPSGILGAFFPSLAAFLGGVFGLVQP